jgi:hypothetical protein
MALVPGTRFVFLMIHSDEACEARAELQGRTVKYCIQGVYGSLVLPEMDQAQEHH